MQLKNKLKVKTYILLSLINMSQYFLFLKEVNSRIFLIYYFGIILNQYILALIVSDLTGIEKNKTLFPTWLLGILKPMTLIGAFYVAIGHSVVNTHIFVEIYIFQLIILVISIKRIVKKN